MSLLFCKFCLNLSIYTSVTVLRGLSFPNNNDKSYIGDPDVMDAPDSPQAAVSSSRAITRFTAADGLVERFHRALKAAIVCHADQQGTEALPVVLL